MCTQCIWDLQCFKTFQNCSLFCTFGFLEISIVMMRIMLYMANIALIIIPTLRTQCISDWKRFETFRNCSLFSTFLLLRNFYSGDAVHANHGKHSLNHHLQHCAHSVYQIYSVLKLFKIAVCFTHFGFYEISTPVMGPMETVVNIVQVIISDIGHTV